MKKIFLTAALILCFSTSAFAQEAVEIKDNTSDAVVETTEQSSESEAEVISATNEQSDGTGYIMVPVRAMAEAFNSSAVVNWDDKTKSVAIGMGERIICMTVGSDTMVVNGVEYKMDSYAMIKDNRLFVPLRDFCHSIGISDDKIHWDPETQTATIN